MSTPTPTVYYDNRTNEFLSQRNKQVTLVTILCLWFNEAFEYFIFPPYTLCAYLFYRFLPILARSCHYFALMIAEQTSISIVCYCGTLQRNIFGSHSLGKKKIHAKMSFARETGTKAFISHYDVADCCLRLN